MKHAVKWTVAAVVSLFVFLAPCRPVAAQQLDYPETRTVDHVDSYHGTEVPDPYRWLEEDVRTSPEVADWVEAQNKVTFSYLESIPERARIRRRLTELWDYEKSSSPFKAGGRYYYLHNSGLQNQSVLLTTADTDDRVVPAHSFKFAARLQKCHTGETPVLIRIETRAGHGAGKPTDKVIEEIADRWAFLVDNLEMDVSKQQ